MNKSVPLWLVLVLVLLALLPTVYFIGVQQGKQQVAQSQPPASKDIRPPQPPPGASSVPLNHPRFNLPAQGSQDRAPSGAPAMGRTPAAQPANLAKQGASKFSHFRVGNRNVKALFSDGDYVWVGTSGGVIRYKPKEDEYKRYDVNNKSLLSNGVFHLNKIGEQLLVGTYGGGLSVLDTKTNSWRNINIPQGLADQFVYDTERLANGDVWVATWSGVNRVRGGRWDDPKAWTTYDKANTKGGIPNDWVYGVEADNQGALWFATEEGVARFYRDTWTNWQHKDGVGAAYDLVKDDIQFSSDPANASQHHARQKQDQGFSRVKGAYNPNYVVALEVTGDTVWAGTWGGGLARFDGKVWKNYTVKDGLPSNHVFTVYQASNGQLWIGTSHGLAKFKDEKFLVYNRSHGLFADNVFSLDLAEDGTLWAGSFGGVAQLQGL